MSSPPHGSSLKWRSKSGDCTEWKGEDGNELNVRADWYSCDFVLPCCILAQRDFINVGIAFRKI